MTRIPLQKTEKLTTVCKTPFCWVYLLSIVFLLLVQYITQNDLDAYLELQ